MWRPTIHAWHCLFNARKVFRVYNIPHNVHSPAGKLNIIREELHTLMFSCSQTSENSKSSADYSIQLILFVEFMCTMSNPPKSLGIALGGSPYLFFVIFKATFPQISPPCFEMTQEFCKPKTTIQDAFN